MTDIGATLAERGKRYGRFEDHARIAQRLRLNMRATDGWSRLSDDQKQALETIVDKIARILNGDPDYPDNWHDIAGYAKLVDDRLSGTTGTLSEPRAAPAPHALAGVMACALSLTESVQKVARKRPGASRRRGGSPRATP